MMTPHLAQNICPLKLVDSESSIDTGNETYPNHYAYLCSQEQ